MRVLTLYEPWATLVVYGHKKIETRSWLRNIKGDLLIHAGKKWTTYQKEVCQIPEFAEALKSIGLTRRDLEKNLGKILGKVNVLGGYPIQDVNPGFYVNLTKIRMPELMFGGYSAGRFGYIMEDPRILKIPIPATGHQGTFNFEAPDESLYVEKIVAREGECLQSQ